MQLDNGEGKNIYICAYLLILTAAFPYVKEIHEIKQKYY